jgi:tight adherence protein C
VNITIVYIGAVLIAVAVAFGVLAVVFTSGEPRGVAKSLTLIEHSVGERKVVKSELAAKDRLLIPFFDQTKALAERLTPRSAVDRISRLLERAGNPVPWTLERVLGVKGAALLVGLILGFLFAGEYTVTALIYAAIGGVALFYLPDIWLYNLALHRQEETSKGLADALDMLTVCVQAGQGFDAAMMQVARNIEGPIAGEFARVLSEVQLGKSRGEAFAAMGDRVTLPEVRNFCSAIVQADRLGIPIVGVLREQTTSMRLARRQKAEEKAQKVTVKILFPLMVCILPALFIVVIGPGAMRIGDMFSNF